MRFLSAVLLPCIVHTNLSLSPSTSSLSRYGVNVWYNVYESNETKNAYDSTFGVTYILLIADIADM